jgi:hypothetical protein
LTNYTIYGIIGYKEKYFKKEVCILNLLFGDVVVVEGNLIGIVVKSWAKNVLGTLGYEYDIYVREYNEIKTYPSYEVERYKVRRKNLNEEDLNYQSGQERE